MPKIKLPTLPEFAMHMRTIVESIASDFEHPGDADDFHPQVTLLPGDGSGFIATAIDPNFFANEKAKDVLADVVLPQMIEASGAKMLAMVLSVWAIEFDGMNEAEARAALAEAQRRPIGDHPNRVERVIVTAYDSHSIAVWTAKILRHRNKPPTLTPWEDWMEKSDDHELVTDGRFVDPLQAALRDSSGRPNPEFLARMRDQ